MCIDSLLFTHTTRSSVLEQRSASHCGSHSKDGKTPFLTSFDDFLPFDARIFAQTDVQLAFLFAANPIIISW